MAGQAPILFDPEQSTWRLPVLFHRALTNWRRCGIDSLAVRRKGGSLASLREANRKRVIDALRERGVASRAELARITGLSRSTVSTIVTDLLEAGSSGERDGQPDGRDARGPPAGDGFAEPAPPGVALGIDFGHRHLRVAVSDLSHTVLAETWRELDVDHSADQGLDAAVEFVDQRARRGRVPIATSVIGVGHGAAGADRPGHRRGAGRLDPPRLGRRRRGRARRALASGCRSRSRTTPTSARSPSSSGAPAKGRSEVVYIKVSSGIGAGLISGGRLQHGVGGTAGEIGHMVLAEGGPGLPLRQPRLPRDARRRPGRSQPCSARSRGEEVSTRRLLELSAARRRGGPAPDRRCGAGDRGRGREPLQPAQPASA